jgi:DNA-directed RNA polymerase subunit RPC12/RpoP
MVCKCPSCGGAITYTEEDAGRIEACPHCSGRLTLPSLEANVATRQRNRRGGALWAFVKIFGLLVLIASFGWLLLLVSTILMSHSTANAWSVAGFASIPAVLGMVLGLMVFVLGRKAGVAYVCSRCGNPVRGTATTCPSCGANFR